MIAALLLVVVLLCPSQGLAAVVIAASCDRAHVEAAINGADYGDIVRIPAGSAVWSTGIDITKDIRIQGAGTANTVITQRFLTDLTTAAYKWTESPAQAGEYYCELAGGGAPLAFKPSQFFLNYPSAALTEGTVGALNDHEWDWGDNDALGFSTVYFRDDTGDPDVSGIVFEASKQNSSNYAGCFQFDPDVTARAHLAAGGNGLFEVTGIHFQTPGAGQRVTYAFAVWIDNDDTLIRRVRVHDCKFTHIHRAVQTDGNIYGCFDNNTLINSNASYPNAENASSWNNYPMTLGSGAGWYVEDNTFTFVDDGSVSGGGHGMGHVIRYNDVTGTHNIKVESHGNQTSGINSTQITEIYGNNFASDDNQGVDIRGGRCVMFFNWHNDDSLNVREEYLDSYSPALTDICAAAGPQICASDCVCQKVNNSYFWNNRRLDNSLKDAAILYDRYDNVVGHDNVPAELVEDREFFNYDAAFDGSGGMGAGSYATMVAITPTCDNVGFWVTSQSVDAADLNDYTGANPTTPISGTLWKWSGSAWEEFYAPYTYPHPLRRVVVPNIRVGTGPHTITPVPAGTPGSHTITVGQ